MPRILIVGAGQSGLQLAVEPVDRDDERQVRVVLEVVDGGEGLFDPARVDEHHGAECPAREVVPQKPEPRLTGRTEQVQQQVGVQGDATEVHRDRGGHLVRRLRQVVDRDTRFGHGRLGGQGVDLRHRSHERCLADTETTGDQRSPNPG